MLTVYLLRHGETDFNAQGNRYCGRIDIDLTEKGIAQANQVNNLLSGIRFDAVYSSPLIRAKKTAEIASGYSPQADNRLIEIDFGLWEGKTKAEFIGDDIDVWKKWCAHPEHAPAGKTGERDEDVLQRMNSFFQEMQIKHHDQLILVVAHNGVNRLYLAGQLGMPIKNYSRISQNNSAITIFQIDREDGFLLTMLNG